MALTHNFSGYLKKVQIRKILFDAVKIKSFFFREVPKDMGWRGGEYEFPKSVGRASSVLFGRMAASTDIGQQQNAKPSESTLVKVFHSLKYDMLSLDLNDAYSDKEKEVSYLKVIKDVVEGASDFFREVISNGILNGGRIDVATDDGTSGGLLTVTFFERFEIGMPVIVRNDDPAAVRGYVNAINVDTGVITIKDDRPDGSSPAAVDLSAYTTAKSSALYYDGTVNTSTGALVSANIFNDFRSSLLSSANGGNATLHGITKASYPQFQAQNIDLSAATSSNLLEKLYDGYLKIKRVGRGMPNKILISYENFGHIAKNLELSTRFASKETSEGFGFNSVKILAPRGMIELVALEEMDNDIVIFWDKRACKLAGHKFFENETMSKLGQPFYPTRDDVNGEYIYIQDFKFYANVIWLHPAYCGIGYGITIS